MSQVSEHDTPRHKTNSETARRAVAFACALEGTERLLKLQFHFYSEAVAKWPVLYLGNIEKAMEITSDCVETITKSQSEFAQLIEDQLHRGAEQLHEIEKEIEKDVMEWSEIGAEKGQTSEPKERTKRAVS